MAITENGVSIMTDFDWECVLLPLLLVIGRLLTVLETAVCRCAILLVVTLLLLVALLLGVVMALVLLRWVARLLISALVPALLRWILLLAMGRVLLLVALVVLVVRAGHFERIKWIGCVWSKEMKRVRV